MFKKLLKWALFIGGLGLASTVFATAFQGYQGGTGISTSTSSTVGYVLQVASTSPFLTYQLAAPTSGSATTTINGAQCPTFTFSVVSTSSDYSITTSSCNIFWNLLSSSTWLKTANNLSDLVSTSTARTNIGYTGLAPISISSTGTIVFTNPGFISTSAIPLFNGSAGVYNLYVAGPGLSIATGTASTTITYSSSTLGLGTLSSINSPLPVANGGRGTTTVSALGSLEVGLSSTQIGSLAVGANGSIPVASSTAPLGIAWQATSTLGISGGGTPAGTSTDVQFNNGGSFSADTGNFTYNSTTKQFGLNTTSSNAVIGSSTNFFAGSLNISATTTVVASSAVFSYTGATTSFVVPTNVTGTITVNVLGAAGGTGASNDSAAGGLGGSATGTFSLASSSAGTTYFLCVGGLGSSTGAFTGGFCGGGQGATSSAPTHSGPGGGMSWVSPASSFATNTVAIVGGGGGGAGSAANGGGGGGLTGTAGSNAASGSGGGGGTPTAGGSAGSAATGGAVGLAGSAGQGAAGVSNPSNGNPSGGGGGGYFGGGSGGSANGANNGNGSGGGSSFMASNLTSTSTTGGVNASYGTVTFTYNVISSAAIRFTAAIGGHTVVGGINPPTISGAPGATVSGYDALGIVTLSSSTTSFTLNFDQYFPNPAICWANIASGTPVAFKASGATTTATFTAASAMATSSKINYGCQSN